MIEQTGFFKYILNNRDSNDTFSTKIITYINTFMQAYASNKGITDQYNTNIEHLYGDILGQLGNKILTISTNVINEIYDRNYLYL